MLDEAAVSLGRSLDPVRTARELTELVVPRFADFASVDLLETVMPGEEPAEAGPEPRHTAEGKIIWAGQGLTDGDHQV